MCLILEIPLRGTLRNQTNGFGSSVLAQNQIRRHAIGVAGIHCCGKSERCERGSRQNHLDHGSALQIGGIVGIRKRDEGGGVILAFLNGRRCLMPRSALAGRIFARIV